MKKEEMKKQREKNEEESILTRELSLEETGQRGIVGQLIDFVEQVVDDVDEVVEQVSEFITGEKISIRFGIHYDTYWGQNIVLVGSSPNLGKWNPSRGQRMTWMPGNYWELEVEFTETGVIEYKYVVVLVDGDRFVEIERWEERNNRRSDLTKMLDSNSTKHAEFWNSWNF